MTHNIDKNAIIAIAGTVGIGKSSLTKTLAKQLNFKTSFENVNKTLIWINIMITLNDGVFTYKFSF